MNKFQEYLKAGWQRATTHKKQLWIGGGLLGALCLLIAIVMGIRSLGPTKVETAPVITRSMPVMITENASTMALHVGLVTPTYTAKIEKFNVKVGDTVKKGQVLATLDMTSLKEQIQLLQASIETLSAVQHSGAATADPGQNQGPIASDPSVSAAIGRAQELLKKGVITQREYDRLQAKAYHGSAVPMKRASGTQGQGVTGGGEDVTVLTQELHRLQALLQTPTIVAPMDGRVSAIYHQEQKIAIEGKALMTIQQASPVMATMVLPSMITGTHMEVTLAVEGNTLPGKVIALEKGTAPTGTQTIVKAMFDNQQGLIIPGHFYPMTLETQVVAPALVVPAQAVHEKEGTYYVYILTDGQHVDARLVTIGAEQDGYRAIVDGLTKDDVVIVTPDTLTLGAFVQPVTKK